ncbi:MAG: hypothetical protein RBR68_11320 [Tenuifilaceae bacterium]|nr:hypothetical protein [Tenuifilaceae bacterium]
MENNFLINNLKDLENEEVEILDSSKICNIANEILEKETLLRICKIDKLNELIFECFDVYEKLEKLTVFTNKLNKIKSLLISDVSFDYLDSMGGK